MYFLAAALCPTFFQIFILMTAVMAMGGEFKNSTARKWLETAGGSVWKAVAGKLAVYFISFSLLGLAMLAIILNGFGVPLRGSLPRPDYGHSSPGTCLPKLRHHPGVSQPQPAYGPQCSLFFFRNRLCFCRAYLPPGGNAGPWKGMEQYAAADTLPSHLSGSDHAKFETV